MKVARQLSNFFKMLNAGSSPNLIDNKVRSRRLDYSRSNGKRRVPYRTPIIRGNVATFSDGTRYLVANNGWRRLEEVEDVS